MPGEFDLIRKHFTRARDSAAPGVVLGVGDDAALFAPSPGTQLVLSTDTLVAGVHFPLDTPPADIGWKSLAVNLSDLAAMGATPRGCLLALTLPQADDDWLTEFARGFFALADRHGCALLGGDTTSGPLAITVTVLGEIPVGAALRRDGAQLGDQVFVSGFPGEAALGLARWQAGARDSGDAALVRLLRPEPRVALGVALRGIASACIDISDGLQGDLGHIVAASGGVTPLGAEIDLVALPRAPLLAALSDEAQNEFIVAGGDDYELCFTVPPAKREAALKAAAAAGIAITAIGRIAVGSAVRCVDTHGNVWQPGRQSWEHFRVEPTTDDE